MPGIFITFEGADGAGKTTQLRLLAQYLQELGFTVVCTREPGGTPLADKIRGLLLDPANKAMYSRTEALLYMAARAQHVAEVILPALSRGDVVLCDRYADSTIVYQGAARKLSRVDLETINAFATNGLTPDLTILLDCDTKLMRGRFAERGVPDRIELEADDFHEQVRQGFKELAAAQPERIRAVAAAGNIEEVHQAVKQIVAEFLHRRSKA